MSLMSRRADTITLGQYQRMQDAGVEQILSDEYGSCGPGTDPQAFDPHEEN